MAQPESPQEQETNLESIHAMARALSKAVGASRLYMPNNPIYQRAIGALKGAFPPIWKEIEELQLELTETDMVHQRIPIYSESNRSESVSWVLYKDGIRSLTLIPGVEDEELVRFLGVVNAARALPPDAEDDILTLLWEEDFDYIRYQFVEVGFGDIPPIDIESIGDQPVQQSIADDGGAAAAGEGDEGEGGGGQDTGEMPVQQEGIDFDARPYFLDRKEIDYLREEIEREYSQDLGHNVISILFDVIELEADDAARTELIEILDRFIPFFLQEKDFRLIAYILAEIRSVANSGEALSDEHRERLLAIPQRLSEMESIELIVEAIEDASPPARPEELDELVAGLGPTALGPIMRLLPTIKSDRLLERLKATVPRLAKIAPEELGNVLDSRDKVVVHRTLELISELGITSLVPKLAGLLQDENDAVRLAAVEALGNIGSPGSLLELANCVADRDSAVRIATARIFAARENMGAFRKIESAILGKEMRSAELAEKTAFFDAYGRLAGDGGVDVLEPILTGGGIMKKKADSELRGCAALALGRIGTKRAIAVLKSAEKDKDPVVRSAVARALAPPEDEEQNQDPRLERVPRSSSYWNTQA